MKLKAFVSAMNTETLGFAFGEPWRYSENNVSCVVPIIYSNGKDRTYLVLPETKKVTIKDSGSIDKVLVENDEDLPLFLRVGELLKGATQERAVTFSQLIPAHSKAKVEVKCVHASKGIHLGALFTSGGYTPGRDSYYTHSSFRGSAPDQSTSWRADSSYHAEASTILKGYGSSVNHVHSDNVFETRQEVEKTFEAVLKAVPLLDNQVGMAIIDTGGLLSLDCFDLHAPWKAVKEAIAGKESLSIAKEDKSGVFEYKPSKAKETIGEILGAGFSEKVVQSKNGYTTVALDWKEHTGEAVLLGDSVVHLMVARKKE